MEDREVGSVRISPSANNYKKKLLCFEKLFSVVTGSAQKNRKDVCIIPNLRSKHICSRNKSTNSCKVSNK